MARGRATLARLLRKVGGGIRLSEHIDSADGEAVFRHACVMGLEGIVAKRRDRPYRSGRSPDWVKVKNPDAPVALPGSSSLACRSLATRCRVTNNGSDIKHERRGQWVSLNCVDTRLESVVWGGNIGQMV